MKKTFQFIIIYFFILSCGNDSVKKADTTLTNIIPWDTLGATVEGNKIKWSDEKTSSQPKNDSILKVKQVLFYNGFQELWKNNVISIIAHSDTSGFLTDFKTGIFPITDTVTEKKINALLIPIIKQSEPWLAATNYQGQKIKGIGVCKLTDKNELDVLNN